MIGFGHLTVWGKDRVFLRPKGVPVVGNQGFWAMTGQKEPGPVTGTTPGGVLCGEAESGVSAS